MSRPGVRDCAIAALLFGASTPAASTLADDVPPLVLAGLLYLGAALVVSPWSITHRPAVEALRRDAGRLAVAVVVGGAIGPALLTAGLVSTPPATASLLLNVELVATVLLAATLFREHLGPVIVAATALVALAGTLLVWQPGAAVQPSGLLIVGACGCWGLDNAVTSRIDQVSPQHVTWLKGVVAGSVNLLLGLAIAGVGGVSAGSVLAALAIGGVGYGVSITLWVRGAQQLGAARGQVIFASGPFVGAIVAWAVLGDPVEPVQVAAVVVAVVGIGLSLRSAHSHEHRHSPNVHSHEHDHLDHHHDDHLDARHHARPDGFAGRHTHPHEHVAVVHAHAHLPDLHHRHDH